MWQPYVFVVLRLCHGSAAFRAELAGHFGAALRAFLRAVVSWNRCAAFRAELAGGLSAAFRTFLRDFGGRSRCAAFRAELASDGCAALRAGDALRLWRSLGLLLLLRGNHATHHVTGGAEAHAGHADSHEAGTRAAFVLGSSAHGAEHAASGQVA